MDRVTPAHRSWIMSRIRGRDTKPEILVRRLIHRMGYRFRLHRQDLPGQPDIVLPRHGKVVFVHGCFWHRHKCRRGRSMPSTRVSFWRSKFEANRKRDLQARRDLRKQGWEVLVVWECETINLKQLENRLSQFLQDSSW